MGIVHQTVFNHSLGAWPELGLQGIEHQQATDEQYQGKGSPYPDKDGQAPPPFARHTGKHVRVSDYRIRL